MLDVELSRLQVLDAGPGHVAEIRAACLAGLGRNRKRREAWRHVTTLWRVRLEAAAATGLAVLFLAAAVERVLNILH